MKKDLKYKIQKTTWEQFWGRKTNVQMTVAFLRGIGSKIFTQTYGSCLSHQLAYFNGKTTYGYAKKEDMKKFLNDAKNRFSQDLNFAKNFPAKNKKAARLALKKVKEIGHRVLKADAQQLIKIYKEFLETENQFYFHAWSNFLWDKFLVDLVQKELEKVCKDKNQTVRYLEIFSVPGYPPPVVKEQLNLLSIASLKNKLSPQKLNEIIKKHAKQFGWMAVYNFGEAMFTTSYYRHKLKKLLAEKIDFAGEIKRINDNFRKNRLDFQKTIKVFKNNKKIFVLANLLHQVPNLRDEREEYRDRIAFCGTEIYRVISKKLGLPLDLVLNFTNEEMINVLESGKVQNLNEVKLRKKKYLVYFANDKIEMSPDNLIDSIVKRIEPEKKIKSFSGLIAQKGIARGKAKIVLSGEDLGKIKDGDIFVATMTKPNFVPALEKCAAIITDEGSILCHAAIVSREMKKPCIVGTKVATKVLKDGMVVEVDAKKGVVKIIKQ